MKNRKQKIPDLMIAAGVMLVLSAIPVGFAFALQKEPGVETRWGMTSGIAMTAAAGIAGGALLLLGETIVQRRRKNSKTDKSNVA